jgi:hypothetical protein
MNEITNRSILMTESIPTRAKSLYESRKAQFEDENFGEFVAIEPDSGEFFVAATFDAAVAEAIKHYPDKISHTIRIGHEAAFHIGLMTQ